MHKAIKRLVFALSLAPALYLVYLGFTNNLGVNPAETLQLETGTWALLILGFGGVGAVLRRHRAPSAIAA